MIVALGESQPRSLRISPNHHLLASLSSYSLDDDDDSAKFCFDDLCRFFVRLFRRAFVSICGFDNLSLRPTSGGDLTLTSGLEADDVTTFLPTSVSGRSKSKT